jgi:Ammonium Transporter Family
VSSVRSKNAKNIVLKNLLDACIGALTFYLIGYGFAFGQEKGNNFIGWNGFALSHLDKSLWYNWLFQFAVRGPCAVRACPLRPSCAFMQQGASAGDQSPVSACAFANEHDA